jgi:hypothetical protein
MKLRRMRWAGHGEKRNAYTLLVGKSEGRRPLGRPRRRWVDNIKMCLVEVGWGDVDWIGRKLNNEELRHFYFSPSIIRMMHTWERRGTRIGHWWESQKGKEHYEEQDVGGWIILRWILER